ncbi:MAG: Adaptive-response sensory-kinase SasA [Fimbriimonadales bacterium]|nr:MAG: GAF domain-containing sensor histidine kinase [Armatimonadota bacterium]MBV6503828.1 Adaptive-response sensory-kinase SasA [Fimbriimonadales bacterium]MCE7899632.1 GAF domain-containing protein [Armatimonadetes bacterium ATM1]MDL1927717.1 GAF domain-containing protein [Fimbriimonadia bacterium ATM]MBC6970687.1 GAF domain-containing protein [Armatimonadota bacterium]
MHSRMDEKDDTQPESQQVGVDPAELTRTISELKRELDELRGRNVELENRLSGKDPRAVQDVSVPVEAATTISDMDATLRRLVQRIAMILQAEKVLMMFFDREAGELMGIPPAYGLDEDIIRMVRVRATHGISGEVFREGRPTIFHDAVTDKRTEGDPFSLLHVHNGVTVPLVIEKRDDENRVIDRTTIGVLHAFNKRHGEDFNDEDVHLLERMAKSAASIISNLRLYQEIVEEKEELLQTLESLYAGLVVTSNEGRVTQMNASARAIFNVTSEVIGRDVRDVILDDEIRALIVSAQEGNEGNQTEATISTDGRMERTYNVQSAQVKNEEGRQIGVVTIFNDVTELKNIERMKSAFVATVSHELRTPLTAIKGFVSTLLMNDDFPEEDRREFYTIIDHECDRLTRLINDLLNIARIEAGESLKPHYSDVDVRALCKKVALIQQQASHNHQLVLDAPDEFPVIVGDEDKLDQIVTNLVSNAIKYSPEGGKVTIHLKMDDDHVLIGVQDQGIGIPKEHLSKVFDRFHRVHNEDNRKIYGTGLGLFLVKHLVEQIHLGKVWAESEVGVGSTFWVRIPIQLDVAKAEELNK